MPARCFPHFPQFCLKIIHIRASCGIVALRSSLFHTKKPRMEPRLPCRAGRASGGDKHNLSLGAPSIKNLGSFIMRYTVTQMLQTTRRVGTYALFADIQDCQSEGEARPPVT